MPGNRITTPFGFSTTADEVLEGVDLMGKRMLVTGGASGIGLETTKALAKAGAEVIVASRNPERARVILSESEGSISYLHLDLSDLYQVKAFCENFDGPLHCLINNSGIMALPTRELTPQGWEMQFGVNHIGHFHLSLGLLKNLKQAKGARVVSVSSQAHSFAPVDFDDINFDVRPYDPVLAYCQSKTANALFAVGAAKRWADDGICVNAVTPGAVLTDLQVHVREANAKRHSEDNSHPESFSHSERSEESPDHSEYETQSFSAPIPYSLIRTPEQAAATFVLCAASPLLDEVTGRYFANCNEAFKVDKRLVDMTGLLPFAGDEKLADRLWEVLA